MNTEQNKLKPAIYLARPSLGMADPDFQSFIKLLIRSIAVQTKNSIRKIGATLIQPYRYLVKKAQVAADSYNRKVVCIDDRYRNNPSHIRSSL